MKALFAKILIFSFLPILSFSQNIGINTDGTTGEAGVMLDVKGLYPIGTTTVQNVFQIKSLNASGAELKMRLALGTHATLGSRYGALEVYDAPNNTYRALSLQPTAGNVGIGTTAPSDKLEVASFVQNVSGPFLRLNSWMEDKSGYISGLLLSVNGGSGSGTVANAIKNIEESNDRYRMDFQTYGTASLTTKMSIRGDGNVGIGITAPLAKLDVSETAAINEQAVFRNAGTYHTGLAFTSTANHLSDANAWGIYGGPNVYVTELANRVAIALPTGVPDFSIMTGAPNLNSSTFTAKFTVLQNGNVGIGTASPSKKLHVYDGAIFNQTASGLSLYIGGNADGTPNAKYSYMGMAAGGNTIFGLMNDDLVTTTEYLRIEAGGKVGIGTGAPAGKLHVYDAADARVKVQGGASTLSLDAQGAQGGFLTTSTNHNLSLGTNNAINVTRESGGNVGIGSTDPSSKLQVVGLVEYPSNAAAVAAGLTVGAFYRTGGAVMVVF